jgi:hypothetical protein
LAEPDHLEGTHHHRDTVKFGRACGEQGDGQKRLDGENCKGFHPAYAVNLLRLLVCGTEWSADDAQAMAARRRHNPRCGQGVLRVCAQSFAF